MNTLQPQDRVLVVGGNGFLGTHLVEKCLRQGAAVTVLSITPNTRTDGAVAFIQTDLTDRPQLTAALQGKTFDYVFNCGGFIDHTAYLKGGRRVIEAHYTGLLNLIDALDVPHLKGFVQVGSSDEYGSNPAPQKETMRERPISPYSIAKTNASHFIQMISSTEGFPGSVVRFFLVYGPGQDEKRFLPQIITACLKNEEFKTSQGIQLRDFCFVEDAMDGMIAAATEPRAKGAVFNIASGAPVRIKDMIETVMKITGGGRPVWGAHPYRQGENMELYADVTAARQLLGWQASTSLEEGMRRTVEYFQSSVTRGQ